MIEVRCLSYIQTLRNTPLLQYFAQVKVEKKTLYDYIIEKIWGNVKLALKVFLKSLEFY